MEPDEKHEPQYEPKRGIDMTEFEEQNYNWLVEKFLKVQGVADLWADFVYNEYCDYSPESPDTEDR